MIRLNETVKNSVKWIVQIFSGPNGEASSKRVIGAYLIYNGTNLAYHHGNPQNVATLIIAGCAFLGVSYFAEKLGGG
jgi:hypothetical protein